MAAVVRDFVTKLPWGEFYLVVLTAPEGVNRYLATNDGIEAQRLAGEGANVYHGGVHAKDGDVHLGPIPNAYGFFDRTGELCAPAEKDEAVLEAKRETLEAAMQESLRKRPLFTRTE